MCFTTNGGLQKQREGIHVQTQKHMYYRFYECMQYVHVYVYIYSIQNALCRVHNNVLTYARTSMSLKDGPYAKGLIGSVTFKNRGKSCSKYK